MINHVFPWIWWRKYDNRLNENLKIKKLNLAFRGNLWISGWGFANSVFLQNHSKRGVVGGSGLWNLRGNSFINLSFLNNTVVLWWYLRDVLDGFSDQIRSRVFAKLYRFFPSIWPQLIHLFLKSKFLVNFPSIFLDKIELP